VEGVIGGELDQGLLYPGVVGIVVNVVQRDRPALATIHAADCGLMLSSAAWQRQPPA